MKKTAGYILTDMKVWGSYKVAQAIGIRMEDVPTGEVYKTGDKKGQPKTRKEPVFDPTIINLLPEELQLSRYAMQFEKAGFPVSTIRLQVIVRDGNTFVATQRGIDKPMYIIELKRLDDREVDYYYDRLAAVVSNALEKGICPPKCNAFESWSGRKCEKYCEVKDRCQEIL